MIDIETMGNISYSSILSIAAVKFDIETGDIGEKFHVNITFKSCLDAGLIVNADTILWWMDRNSKARKAIISPTNPVSLVTALLSFNGFCSKEYFIWGNSPRFDLGLIQNAYNKLDLPIPWDFRKERDVRTLVGFAPEIKNNHVMVGVAHNPIDDCLNQISYCTKTYNTIFNEE